MKLWDLESGALLRTLHGHENIVTAADVTPDGRYVVSCSLDRTIRVWELVDGKSRHILKNYDQVTAKVAIESNGQYKWIWSDASAPGSKVRSVKLCPDGRKVISWSEDKIFMEWDCETGLCLRKLEGNREKANSVSVSPEGWWIISIIEDSTIRILDIGSGNTIAILPTGQSEVASYAVSAQRIVIGLSSGVVMFADMKGFPVRASVITAANSQRACCSTCGKDFELTPAVVSAIRVADEDGLSSQCPYCHHPLLFNPFFSAEDDYIAVLRRGLEFSRRERGPEHDETLAHLAALAVHLGGMGKHDEANVYARERDEIAARIASRKPMSDRQRPSVHEG